MTDKSVRYVAELSSKVALCCLKYALCSRTLPAQQASGNVTVNSKALAVY